MCKAVFTSVYPELELIAYSEPCCRAYHHDHLALFTSGKLPEF